MHFISMLKRLKVIIFSPFFHSFLISLIVILLLPDIFSKFTVKVIETGENTDSRELIFCNDLDLDGSSEEIHSFFSTDSLVAIQIFKSDGGFLEQWNMQGEIPGINRRIYITDYNHDSIKEIFVFGYKEDSLLLSCFNPYRKNEFLMHQRFITNLSRSDGKIDYEMSSVSSSDFNKDYCDELIFSVNKGKSFQPRQIFIYDIANDSLWRSPLTGVAFNDLKLIDLNHDGIMEITGDNCASGNVKENDSIPYSDYSAWVICYDQSFKVLFSPVEFKGIHSTIISEPIIKDTAEYLAAFYNHTGPLKNNPAMNIFDRTGKYIEKVYFPDSTKNERCFFRWPGHYSSYYITDDKGAVHCFTEDFKFRKVTEMGCSIHPKPEGCFDLDGDGNNEMIFFLADNKHGIIYREGFKDSVLLSLPVYIKKTNLYSCQLVEKKNTQPELFIQQGEVWQKYSYSFNKLYYFKYPIYVGIYIAILGLVFLIRYLQRLQIREKLELQSQIAQFQLKSFNQQIDPHFTFNAFNSIASLLKKEKGETAYNYFMQFTDLIRISLVTSDKIYRSLEEELKVVRNYLDIQKLRFTDRFNFEINISPEVSLKRMIPKMIIQTFTENAVKHGFRETKTGGILEIEITMKDEYLSIMIRDNGIGRKRAGELKSDSTGLGLSALDKYISLLNKYNALKIEKEIIDLYDETGRAAGTKVILSIPDIGNNI
jgi:hypothetical protein